MGRIFVVMGKSASGKDTIYKQLLEQMGGVLKSVVGYTTRPIRSGEQDGVEYFFVDEETLARLREENKVIECRTYHTVFGDWNYFTVNDGQIALGKQDYLMISTLAGYEQICTYYGKDKVVPIYIEVNDRARLLRAVTREKTENGPNYAEVCRRYLADEVDFSEEELNRLQITRRYHNQELKECLAKIRKEIEQSFGKI